MTKLSTILFGLAAYSASYALAQQNDGPVPKSIIMVLPPDGLTIGQELSVGVTRAADTSRDQSFYAYQVFVSGHDEPSGATNNVTGMADYSSAGGSYNLGNATYTTPWSNVTGDFITLAGNSPICTSATPGTGGLATFNYNTSTWPAAAYVVNLREIVYYGSKGVEQVNDTTWCISPPFTNYTAATMAYVNLVPSNASTLSAGTVQESTTTISFATGVNAAGSKQTAPANVSTGAGSRLSITAGLVVSFNVAAVVVSL